MASVSSEQLVLLHQELAALVRAGLPLDSGLRSLAADLPGNLGQTARHMASRLEAGERLDDVLVGGGSSEQRVYRAVIAAGIRSGDLNGALESVVGASRASNHLRRSLWAELVYPILLLFVGYGLLQFSLAKTGPVEVVQSEKFEAYESWMAWITAASTSMDQWSLLPPLLFIVAIAGLVWLVRRGTSLRNQGSAGRGLLAGYRRSQALARFCSLLALMIDRAVPLPEALALAGEASGWRPLAKASGEMSQRLVRGEPAAMQPPVPATVVWLVSSGSGGGPELLRREAARYQAQAKRQARWLVTWLPLVATLVIGATFAILLALINLGPFLNLLFRLSRADA
jgi:general secretion pathway protein F